MIDFGTYQYYYVPHGEGMISPRNNLHPEIILIARSFLIAAAGLLSIVLLAAPASAASFEERSGKQSSAPQRSAADAPSVIYSGYLSMRYTFRTAETASNVMLRDQDAYTDLRVDVTGAKKSKYEFHFMGSARKDLDGNRDLHTNYLLEDIGDTGNKATIGYLYEAHFDINDPFTRVPQVRLGRQAGTRDEQIYFDGIAVDVRAASFINMTLYGGAAVNHFEIDRAEGDDTLAGAGLDIAAGRSTGISIDYLTINDKRDYLELKDVHDKLLSLKLWQRFTPSVKATMRFRQQNSEARDLNLRLLGTFPTTGTELSANYLRQFNTQEVQSNPLSPFVDVVGASEPFQTTEVKVRQFFGRRYAFDVLYAKRDLVGDAKPGQFNRAYTRAAAGFEVGDLYFRDLTLTLTGDQWKSEERSSSAAGADLGYSFGKKGALAKINVGTYYSMYKYDYYLQPSEKTDVRTYYLTTKVPVVKQVALSLSYEFERSMEDYQTFKAGIRYDF